MSNSSSKIKLLPIAVLILAIFSIQVGASISKSFFPIAGAMGTATIRVFLAAIMLVLYWKPWRVRLAQAEWAPLFFYGASLGLMNLFFYLALARIPLGIAVAIEFTGPLVVTVLSSRKLIDYFWVILAGLGVFFILPTGGFSESVSLVGIAFAFLAAFFWAIYIVFGAKAGKFHTTGVISSLGMCVAALVVVPTGVMIQGSGYLAWSILPMGLAIAFFSSALPYSLEMYALKNMPTKEFGILLSLEPVFAALVGWLVLKEHLTFVQFLAIALIIGASVGVTITSKQHPPIVD